MSILSDFKGQIKLVNAHPEIVKAVQHELNRVGYPLVEDGIPGLHTISAFEQFKKEHFLAQPDMLGQTTAVVLLQTQVSKFLNAFDYLRASQEIGLEVALIKAVVAVETAGSGFFPNGLPKILFERHIFHSLTPVNVSASRPDLSNPQQGGYIGGEAEWGRLNAAMKFDRVAALKSASWGLGQIMGFNYGSSGFSDIDAFVSAMKISEGKQLLAMMTYVKNETGIYNALKNHNWAEFARLYNGPQYFRNHYDVNLAQAYKNLA